MHKTLSSSALSLLLMTLGAQSAAVETLSTVGTASPGSTLYACSTSSMKNPNPADGRDRIHTTRCRKVAQQDMHTNPSDAHKYAPGASMTDVDAAFFWHRQDGEIGGSSALASVCATHRDHFKDCEWTKVKDDVKVEQQVIDKADNVIKDILKDEIKDLTKPGVYGCAVTLCLANPNGWRSEEECHPPIRKLFRDLAHGRPFPKCKM